MGASSWRPALRYHAAVHTPAPPDADRIARLLERHAEIELRPAQLRFERRDWRWLAFLPGSRALYVAQAPEGRAWLARERALLRALAPRLRVAVPQPLADDAFALGLDVRALVPGETMWGLRPEHRARVDAMTRFARALGTLAAELHGALPADELARLVGEPCPERWPPPPAYLRARVPGSLRAPSPRPGAAGRALERRMLAVIDRYERALDDARAADEALVHDDLGSHNLVFEPRSKRLVGVFDFAGAGWRDRHLDFKFLPSYGDALLETALTEYEARAGVRPSRARVRTYHAATAIAYLAWRVDDPVAHDRDSGRDFAGAVTWIEEAVTRALEVEERG